MDVFDANQEKRYVIRTALHLKFTNIKKDLSNMVSRLFATFVLIAFFPAAALACSCGKTTFEDSFKRATTVVTAEVIDHIGTDKVTLRFNDVWKGNAPKTKETTIASGLNASCAPTSTVQPAKGTRYLFYLGDIPEEAGFQVRIQTCGRNGLYEDMERDVIQLKAYKAKLEAVDAELIANSDSEDAWLQKVAFYREYGDLVKAKALLHDITARFDESVDAWAQLSEVTYQQAEQISPLGRGDTKELRIKRKKALYEDALRYAEKTLTLDPESQVGRNIKNGALLHLERADEVAFLNVDYSGTQMERQHFSGKKLQQVSFAESRIYGLLFTDSQLNDVSFKNARLGHAKFQKSTLENVDFSQSEITDTRVKREGDFAYAIGGFEGADINDSSFKNSRLALSIKNTNITNSDFENASFQAGYEKESLVLMEGVNAKNTNFRGIKTHHNGFALGVIKDSVFANCDFSNAAIGSHIIQSDFSTSKLENINLTGSMFDCATKWPEGFDPIAHGASAEEKECKGKEFSTPDFEGKVFNKYHSFGPVDLEGANFKNAKLKGSSFIGANLKGVDFSGATIENADLRDANLEGANFTNVHLYGVNFGKANLKDAIFAGADFSNARFDKDSNLHEANLTLARIHPDAKALPDNLNQHKHQYVYWANNHNGNDKDGRACLRLDSKPIKSPNADLTGVSLAYACLEGADFQNTVFDKGSLYNSDLTGANLEGASFIGTRYSCNTILPPEYSHIRNTMVIIGHNFGCRNGFSPPAPQLENANLYKADLSYGQLRNANLKNADLRETNLASANLMGADLTGAKLEGAHFDHGTKWPQGFDYLAAGAVADGVAGGRME